MYRVILWPHPFLTLLAFGVFIHVSGHTYAQTPAETTQQTSPASPAQEEAFQASVGQMLHHAQLVRTLAAEHLVYIKENRSEADIRLIEDAAQVMAFNLTCPDDTMQQQALDQIATDTSFKIAMMAGNSTIGEKLAHISTQQSMKDRMELIGGIASTVLMFEVGRRRGLFDALLKDFGQKRFCAGMQADMRTRYNGLVTGMGN